MSPFFTAYFYPYFINIKCQSFLLLYLNQAPSEKLTFDSPVSRREVGVVNTYEPFTYSFQNSDTIISGKNL